MRILLYGTSHKRAPVEFRERLAFPEVELKKILEGLRGECHLDEAVVLSTCNRVEIYGRASDRYGRAELIRDFISRFQGLDPEEVDRHCYFYLDRDAVRHCFRVGSSLDSMIVGEPQITGQVKEAYFEARKYEATGPILNNLFERTFNVAKRVRTETGIAEHAVSVSFAAVELARKIFADLEHRAVMLVGAGEMSELAARHLITHGVVKVIVTNRTYERAEELAGAFCGEAVPFEHWEERLPEADIVISSTGSPQPIITKERVQRVLRARQNRPMFFVDIAVPRDIEPELNELANVYCYDIDDLQTVVESNIHERQREAVKAEEIVNQEARAFLQWYASLDAVPTIVELIEKTDRLREQEVAKTLAKLGHVSDRERQSIEAMANAIVKKVLHDPIVSLKKNTEGEEGSKILETARRLFRLD
ncbi:MAG: glutamyl-tRNA reductase [Nitrospinota bacterium]